MTLAEIREVLKREIVAVALARDESVLRLPLKMERDAVVLRRGRSLVLKHVRRGQGVRWYGTLPYYISVPGNLHGDSILVVERVERDQVMFEHPRLVMKMSEFLDAVVKGAARDDP